MSSVFISLVGAACMDLCSVLEYSYEILTCLQMLKTLCEYVLSPLLET